VSSVQHNYGVEILKNYSNDTNLINKLKANNTKVDILFIDGDHTRQAVINDWNNFKDFVNPGGFICFDDYYDDKVREKLLENNIQARKYYHPLDDSKVANEIYNSILCIPCNIDINKCDIDYIFNVLTN
jgi:hypothetical protein